MRELLPSDVRVWACLQAKTVQGGHRAGCMEDVERVTRARLKSREMMRRTLPALVESCRVG